MKIHEVTFVKDYNKKINSTFSQKKFKSEYLKLLIKKCLHAFKESYHKSRTFVYDESKILCMHNCNFKISIVAYKSEFEVASVFLSFKYFLIYAQCDVIVSAFEFY